MTRFWVTRSGFSMSALQPPVGRSSIRIVVVVNAGEGAVRRIDGGVAPARVRRSGADEGRLAVSPHHGVLAEATLVLHGFEPGLTQGVEQAGVVRTELVHALASCCN